MAFQRGRRPLGYGAAGPFLSRVTPIKGSGWPRLPPMASELRCPLRVPMRIGDKVIYEGRVFVLLGHDPMSVTDRRAEVVDPKTGERFFVPFDELEAAPPEPKVSPRRPELYSPQVEYDRAHAGDAHLRGQLRLGRQATDRPVEDGRREQVPADLDRPSRGCGDPDEAAEPGGAAADDARPPERHARAARGAGHAASRSPSCARTRSTRRSPSRRTARRSRSTRGRRTRSRSRFAPRRRSSPPTA